MNIRTAPTKQLQCELSTISPTATTPSPTPEKTASPSGEPLVTPPPNTAALMPISAARAAEYDALNLPLIVLAENLHDIELTRIAMGNRLRQLQALDAGSGDIEVLADIAEGMAQLEHQVVLRLRRAMRAHPLGPWVKRSKGVGEKQAARLLAAIGNPCWNSLHDRPRRGPAELWAYCGYHVVHDDGGTVGVAPRRRKGQRSNWNTAARTRAYLVAESCMKSLGGEYRAVYDLGRAKYAGLPTLKHEHNRALRLVSKAVLRDIYLEARAWHEAEA